MFSERTMFIFPRSKGTDIGNGVRLVLYSPRGQNKHYSLNKEKLTGKKKKRGRPVRWRASCYGRYSTEIVCRDFQVLDCQLGEDEAHICLCYCPRTSAVPDKACVLQIFVEGRVGRIIFENFGERVPPSGEGLDKLPGIQLFSILWLQDKGYRCPLQRDTSTPKQS